MTARALERDRTERWFVRQGLPNLIDHYSVREDVLTRMFPFMALVVFLELFLVFGDRWSGISQGIALLGGVLLMLGAFVVVNRLRGRPLWMLPDTVGTPEILLYLVLPAIPTAIGAQDALGENILWIVGINIVILVVGFVLTSWGILPMMRWSLGQVRTQMYDIANLTMKSLPILLLFSAFIFLNAEMWQVANDFKWPYFLCVLLLVLGIGSAFVMLSVKRITVDLARFHRWEDVRPFCDATPVEGMVPANDDEEPHTPPLGRRAEWNVALLLFVSQAIQILLVAVVITAFYLLFGLFTVREDTLVQWTTTDALTREADWLRVWSVFGDKLIFTRQLVLVSAFIGMMSGLQFAVQVVTDESYREEFAEGMTAEVREAMAVRAVYHRVLVEPGNVVEGDID
ncbi:MAG: hypothetical protein P8J50_08745 [Acidimicrobiales bacterium]|jgi:hypothetical protein|nr:hypothetical protein [Acidimicrobiales bacterium]